MTNNPPVLTQRVTLVAPSTPGDFTAAAKYKVVELAQLAQPALLEVAGGTEKHLQFLGVQMELIREIERMGAQLSALQGDVRDARAECARVARAAAATPPLQVNMDAISRGISKGDLKELTDAAYELGHACASTPGSLEGGEVPTSLHSLRQTVRSLSEDICKKADPRPYDQVQASIVELIATWMSTRISELDKTRASWQFTSDSNTVEHDTRVNAQREVQRLTAAMDTADSLRTELIRLFRKGAAPKSIPPELRYRFGQALSTLIQAESREVERMSEILQLLGALGSPSQNTGRVD